MMSKKVVKNYTYTGLGFPIELHQVEMVKFEGEWHPKIDVRKVADFAIKSLVAQESRLTGDQIRFIRSYFSISLRDFAKVVNESHSAVKKWEDFSDKPTNMDLNIEIMLRLYIFDQVVIKTERKKIEFYNCYASLKKIFLHYQSVRNFRALTSLKGKSDVEMPDKKKSRSQKNHPKKAA